VLPVINFFSPVNVFVGRGSPIEEKLENTALHEGSARKIITVVDLSSFHDSSCSDYSLLGLDIVYDFTLTATFRSSMLPSSSVLKKLVQVCAQHVQPNVGVNTQTYVV
jgi:hypothetical protein